MKAWNVMLGDKVIDTVFYTPASTAEEIKNSLINHDGYPPGIEVSPRKW